MRSLLADRHAYVAGLVTAIVGFTSAFVVTGLLIVATAAVPALGTLIARIPTSIAQAMLAGVIVPLCLKPVLATATSPGLMWPILLAWVVVLLHRVHPCRPALRLASGVGIALPLWLVTMASQNVPGVAVLKSFGYETPWRPTLLVTGIGTVVGAFAGGHAICMAAVLYLFLAAGAGIVTAIMLAAPGGLLPAAAGLALVHDAGLPVPSWRLRAAGIEEVRPVVRDLPLRAPGERPRRVGHSSRAGGTGAAVLRGVRARRVRCRGVGHRGGSATARPRRVHAR